MAVVLGGIGVSALPGVTMLDLAGRYSMAPIGGVFLATVGATIILGGFVPRFRQASIWTGLALGVAVAAFFSRDLLFPPPPTAVQLASLLLAVAVEALAFLVLMPRLHRAGERAVVAGTLAIVGGHFILMLPAFGPLIGVLGGLCLLNAWAVWRTPSYPLAYGWTADGAIKLALGLMMLLSLRSLE